MAGWKSLQNSGEAANEFFAAVDFAGVKMRRDAVVLDAWRGVYSTRHCFDFVVRIPPCDN